jgi:ribosome assembly protein 1
MAQLETGLKLLCQADPCAESYLQEETGEYILATAGELHLEACLKDLRERFTKIDIEVSPPMVPFRETITESKAINESFWNEGLNQEKGEGATNDGILTLCSPNGILKLSIRAMPLRAELMQFLGRNRVALRNSIQEHEHGSVPILEKACIEMNKAKLPVSHEISSRNIFGFGPRREGTCLLLATDTFLESLSWAPDMRNSLVSGFMMAVDQGPLCAEPMMGVGFILENISIDESLMPTDATERCVMMTQLKGQLISITKDTCHRAFMFHSPRLMLAYYSCDIQTTTEVLGRVYSVVSRRMGQILSEEYNDGTGFFTIRSLIPVPESFGFADDIRGKTSGLAIPQLLFNGFRVFDQDPFWVPSTEEELEEFGEVAEKANVALRYLIGVRERKGLFVEKKIVQSAEKQRTLKK